MTAAALTSPLLAAQGARHAFSLRGQGGAELDLTWSPEAAEAVQPRLAAFLQEAGIDPWRVAQVRQVHGDRVLCAAADAGALRWRSPEAAPVEAVPEADAIIALEGAAAGIRTADCVPILLFDPRSGVAAAVHAGWRGTALRIAGRTVAVMAASAGVRPDDLVAAIGPHIGRCCYEVGPDLADRFEAMGRGLVERTGTSLRLDLAEANRRWLTEAGVAAPRIDRVPGCTACEPGRFFSHRRDAGRAGRHLAVIQARARLVRA